MPRAVHRLHRLGLMVTDAWMPPDGAVAPIVRQLSPALAARYHSDLADANVDAWTGSLLVHESGWRLRGLTGWQLPLRRNAWFQRRAAECLASRSGHHVVFAHSYAARRVFQLARARGWTTVLGQIDPGPKHFEIVHRLAERYPQYGPPPELPPPAYFGEWHEECRLADHVVVNSEWSRGALEGKGIDPARIHVIPLACSPDGHATLAPREFPSAFGPDRPLRLVFVGSLSVVKGVPFLLDAMRLLRGLPVRLRLVGQQAMDIPSAAADAAIEFAGSVSRAAVSQCLREADVLVFPSLSDGFGMVQIEAQAAGLPIIASRSSGRVVVDGVSGLLLPEVTADAIAAAVRSLLDHPVRLSEFSRNALARPAMTMEGLGEALVRIVS